MVRRGSLFVFMLSHSTFDLTPVQVTQFSSTVFYFRVLNYFFFFFFCVYLSIHCLFVSDILSICAFCKLLLGFSVLSAVDESLLSRIHFIVD